MKTRTTSLPTIACFMLAVAVLLFSSGTAVAQEHPEHPTKAKPEKPKSAQVSVDQMAQAITDFVNSDSKLKGGYFFVFDVTAKKPLQLTLDKVHKERLSQVGENLYFACSDFKEVGGKTYDLDFFMKSVDGKLTVTELMIHKEEGNPRYSWYEEAGIWKRK